MALSNNKTMSQTASNGAPLLSGSKSGFFAHSNLLQRSETYFAFEKSNNKATVDDLDKIQLNYNINLSTTDLRNQEEKESTKEEFLVE